ncbi:MAG: hypothetical protein QM755_04950 [Luteolibacter sp.]
MWIFSGRKEVTLKLRRLLRIGAGLLMLGCVGRIYTWTGADNFGRAMKGATSILGRSGFRDTKAFWEFTRNDYIAPLEKRAGSLPFLGGSYGPKIEEFKNAYAYLSEQDSLPEAQRFSSPPQMKYIPLDTSDRSDRGVVAAVTGLIENYRKDL